MAKFITFNGTTLIHPGGLTKVDADGMSQVGAGVSGVVGVIGEAEYGQPYDPAGAAAVGEEPKVWEFTDPESMADTFKTGELADAVDFLFNPSNDVRIPGGVQRVIALKSNIDVQSSAVAQNIAADAVSCTFKSKIYGKHSNAVSATTSVNATDGNTIDVSITDGNTNVTETFTGIVGKALFDVQYAPSEPVQVGAVHSTGLASGSANVLTWGAGAIPAAITAQDEGRYVQITGHNGQPDLLGQVRRIRTGGYDNPAGTLTLAGDFCDNAGGALIPDTGTSFKIIREAIGPFFVKSYNSALQRITVEGNADDQPSGWTTGSPLFWAALGTDIDCYKDARNGPCYIHIISGTGAGQIRRINESDANAGTRLTTFDLVNGFATNPDNTSQFVFINAVPKNAAGTLNAPTSTDGNAMGEGAYGVVAGASGLANSLALHVRPGWGEPLTHGGASVAVNTAGVARQDWAFTLSSTFNINAFVNALNGGTTGVKGSDATVGAWKAQSLGRDGTLATSRLDFAGRANGAFVSDLTADGVDCLCDFDTTNIAGYGTYNVNPNRYHRFVDNVAQFVETVNAQSVIMSATRATAVGGAPYAGANWGDGIPAFATYALSGGAYNATTSSGLQACFDELIKRRHNTSVALWSKDTANFSIDYVHSLLLTNAKRGAAAYKNEIDCIAAYQPQGVTSGPDILKIKEKALTLNNRNLALVFQDIKRPGLNGKVNQYEPHMLACAIAGMQAGSTVGTPLTYKLVRANKILCKNTSIDVLDKTTSDDFLLNGILFSEFVKGKGYRVVRNLSTYVSTDNLAYTDRHVNYELNFMAYDLRTFIEERFIGEKSTAATVASIKSSVISKLEYYKSGLEIIVDSQDPTTGSALNAYKNLKITISGDICTIRFEIFPAVGINYITFEIFAQLPTLSA